MGTELPCACATARQLARVLTQLYDKRLRSSGVEAPQFGLLLALESLGASSQVELGRRFALDKTTVSRNLKVLERNGWIEPAPSKDARKREFILTEEGRKRLKQAKPPWKKAQDDLRAQMTAAQWDEMFQAFQDASAAAQRLTASD